MEMTSCTLCPRKCGADRTCRSGFCGGGTVIRIARAALHHWEEPCISGWAGSGTVFFSGCPLRCCFCQNYQISAENFGKEISIDRLTEIFLELQSKGAHNINLVNPTHYVPWIIKALDQAKPQLNIPIVYNSGGYESLETLCLLEGIVDIYLPDLKYASRERAKRYSGAPDYFEVASGAILEMYRQTGKAVLDESGIMQKGLMIRHLVLPKGREDSKAVLEWIAHNLPLSEVLVSLMSQYTPFYRSAEFPEINRRVSTFEYHDVLTRAQELGIQGFMQEKSAAKEEYTPAFDLFGV
ncbi:radical SAM protein [Oscillospiraceae bacterium PP1C4]